MVHPRRRMSKRQLLCAREVIEVALSEAEAREVAAAVAMNVEVNFWQVLEAELMETFVVKVANIKRRIKDNFK